MQERRWHPTAPIFLIFGGNVEEISPVVKKVLKLGMQTNRRFRGMHI